MAINKVILLGNVGKDPDVRYPAQGQVVATFSLATSDRAYTNAAGVKVPERIEWHNIVAWGKNAEVIEKYVKKGTKLYIEGKLRTRTWEDKNAIKRYVTEIYVDSFELLGSKPVEVGEPVQQPEEPKP
ncbi:MAG: single-stranded DNA-binding protein [Muribaculaceae bacterium]|nr:single-stranded DNA-binding protein [Muribaculaceae bacterium]